MRLTADLVLAAPSRISPTEDREVTFRGLKIPAIENLGVAQDGYDALDLCDNAITRLENFPLMRRLRALYLANNLISRVSDALGSYLPNLEVLVLTNNKVGTLLELERLSCLNASLLHLTLLHNPVTKKQNYRYYVLLKFPRLRSLDLQKVSRKERLAAAKYWASKAGKAFLSELAKSKAAMSAAAGGTGAGGVSSSSSSSSSSSGGGAGGLDAGASGASGGFTPEEMAAIQAAIAAATTAEEIDSLSEALAAGRLPAFLIPRFRPHLLLAAEADKDAPIPVAAQPQ